MQLNLTGHHVEVTPAMRAYVEKKLDRIIRHSDHVLMYAAIDALADKLDRSVKKHKEKLTDHHAQEAIKAKLA
jgi:putative sigma-54 modulation protein